MPVDLTVDELKEMGFRPISELGKPETRQQRQRRIKYIKEALVRAGEMRQTQPCTLCKKSFTAKGKYHLHHCKSCIKKLLKDDVWEKNTGPRVVKNFV